MQFELPEMIVFFFFCILVQNNSDDHSFMSEKERNMRGVPWKDSSKGDLGVRQVDHLRGRIPAENISTRETDKHEPVRKSKRVPKKRSLEGVLDDAEDDDEIRYLEKIKTTRLTADYGVEHGEDGRKKQRKISKVLTRNVDGLYELDVGDYGSSKLGKEAMNSRSGRTSEDTDYLEEDEESVSDVEPENRRKKAKKDIVDFLGDSKKEMTVTTRQRALQAGKDVSSSFGIGAIEFPNGLPPAPPKSKYYCSWFLCLPAIVKHNLHQHFSKSLLFVSLDDLITEQKEKLSEVEQQLKKAEAAQRRRMQVEKAARESEVCAIVPFFLRMIQLMTSFPGMFAS